MSSPKESPKEVDEASYPSHCSTCDRLREIIRKDNKLRWAVLNMLSVVSPIDWVFVFSAPNNGGQYNSDKMLEAIQFLEHSLLNENS